VTRRSRPPALEDLTDSITELLPFDRLRALARYSGDDTELVLETADCIADFGPDPTQLVTVCRRLLAHHPACGPLWWLCARVVAAPDPAAAARDAGDRLSRDRTSSRLASVLPFPHDEPIAVLGWPERAGAALAERPDLDVVVVRDAHSSFRLRARGTDELRVRMVDLTEALAASPSHLLVEVDAICSSAAMVPEGTSDLLWSLGTSTLWLVAGVGRLLPDRLFEVARAEIERADDPSVDPSVELIDLGRVDRVAGPNGLDPLDRFFTRLDCPVAPELLRL
jgi:hypothetical protein